MASPRNSLAAGQHGDAANGKGFAVERPQRSAGGDVRHFERIISGNRDRLVVGPHEYRFNPVVVTFEEFRRPLGVELPHLRHVVLRNGIGLAAGVNRRSARLRAPRQKQRIASSIGIQSTRRTTANVQDRSSPLKGGPRFVRRVPTPTPDPARRAARMRPYSQDIGISGKLVPGAE